MEEQLDALQNSVDRLRGIVAELDDADLEQQAYPSEWRIADVLSHIGSSAVIGSRRLDDGLEGRSIPDDFAPTVWAAWNAKSPREMADDALTADRVLFDRLRSLTDEERERFRFALGPMEFDITGFVGLRINEHGMHTWDIEVALDPSATLHAEQTALIIDNLDLIARFTGKPTGSVRSIVVRTTDPEREFVLQLASDSVTFARTAGGAEPQLRLTAEAFARLVYGRLDVDHTPAIVEDDDVLDELRQVFPGPDRKLASDSGFRPSAVAIPSEALPALERRGHRHA